MQDSALSGIVRGLLELSQDTPARLVRLIGLPLDSMIEFSNLS